MTFEYYIVKHEQQDKCINYFKVNMTIPTINDLDHVNEIPHDTNDMSLSCVVGVQLQINKDTERN